MSKQKKLPKVSKGDFGKMEFFTVKDLAEYLQISEMTVRRLSKSKKIPSFRVGGLVRFHKNRIDRMFDTLDKFKNY